MRRRHGRHTAWIACTLAVLALAWMWSRARAIDAALDAPRALQGVSYVGSGACRACHPGNYDSWHDTFHRTMTQTASARSVLGDFEHGSLDYLGVQARMRRDAEGGFRIEFSRAGGRERWSATIERTVGSRRFQQYLARDGDVYYRLPIAWNIAEQRFMHMNGAFLTPDPSLAEDNAAVARTDYDRHVTRWNDNCIYCHNVGARAGLDPASERFDTRVAELGIACEACHGPGGRHVSANRDPLRRFLLHASRREDPSITNPRRLSAARSAEVCGHCHGQRITPDIARVHREGDRFIPGEDLAAYSSPLARDTTLNGEHGVFAARFWPDGTARLTAYEYQGLLQSACARRGELTCTSCHGMHEGDPRGQLRPNREGDDACTGCHSELTADADKTRHSHHLAAGAGARCTACHMPRVVYGLVGVHRSHRIDVPNPAASPESGRPDACTLCHVDRARAWAAAELARWSGTSPASSARTAGGDEPAATTRLILAGDPIERAVAADALGRDDAARARAGLTPRARLLLDAMQNDAYPAVRAVAWHALRQLWSAEKHAALPVTAFTPTDPLEQRTQRVAALRAGTPELASRLSEAERTLRSDANAAATAIFIGE